MAGEELGMLGSLSSAGGGMGLGPWGMLAGLAKGELIDRPAAARDAVLQARTAMYSPWTGMQPGKAKDFNTLSGPMAGLQAGIGMEQNMADRSMKSSWNDLMRDYVKKQMGGTSPQEVEITRATAPAASRNPNTLYDAPMGFGRNYSGIA